MEKRIRLHLGPFFYVVIGQDGKYAGGMKSVQVTTDYINRYVVARQSAGAMNGTINRELSVLRRGFSLGMTATPPKVSQCPNFPRLKESPPRKGFLEDNHYRVSLRPARRQVDPMNRTIRLHPGGTKNDDARCVVMTDAVYMLLSECVRGKKGDDYVFTRRNGKPVRDFRKRWRNACIAAGVPEALFHD